MYLADQEKNISNQAIADALSNCSNSNPISLNPHFTGSCSFLTYYPLYQRVVAYTQEQQGNLDFVKNTWTNLATGYSFSEAFDLATVPNNYSHYETNFFFGTTLYDNND